MLWLALLFLWHYFISFHPVFTAFFLLGNRKTVLVTSCKRCECSHISHSQLLLMEKRHSQDTDACCLAGWSLTWLGSAASVSKYISDWLIAKELRLRKQTSSLGCALRLGSFTAIIPCQPVNNYYLESRMCVPISRLRSQSHSCARVFCNLSIAYMCSIHY